MTRRKPPDPITMFVVGVGLSLIAGLLLKPKSAVLQNDKPTTLSLRGSYTPWYVGVRRVGPVFAGAWDRELRKEKASGGKGTGSPKSDVWYESGWHQIGTGQCHALHAIIDGGKTIFTGPITSESHPSGSSVQIDDAQSFTIFWGELDQPTNTFLGDAARVGITSRWPNCCYVVWNKKRLGSSPQWGVIDYVMERRPTNGVLTQSEPWYEPTGVLSGDTAQVTANVASSNPDVGYIEVNGDFTSEALPDRPVQITGNGLPNGDYIVLRSTAVLVTVGTNPINGFPIKATRTRIFLENGTVGSNSSGTVESYNFDTFDGANIAHAAAELLFADSPLGLNLDPDDDLEPWDRNSLEALGVEAETRQWRASLVSVDGETAESLLASILQDHGTLLPIDITTGKMLFQRVREPSGTLANLSINHESESLPEIDNRLDDKPVDRMVFAFTDRGHNFSEMTIAVDEDGQGSYAEFARPRKVPISTTVLFFTAADLAEVRSQEELAGAGLNKITATRGARNLLPGQAIIMESLDEVQRVMSVKTDPLSETVDLEIIPDFYGARKSDFENSQGGGAPVTEDAEQDLQFAFLEVPEQLLSTDEMFILIARIRAHSQTFEAGVHISRDDSTYTQIGEESGPTTGGQLDVAMSAGGKNFLANGPTFGLLGPDASTALDLSADPVNFGLGRQFCAIVSTAGIEVCFVQKITAVSGSQYRLDGLLRARYDTRKAAHPIGAQVYVFSNTALQDFQDALLEPGEDLYLKTQPFSQAGTVPLSSIPPYGDVLRGKGLVPINAENLHVTAPFNGVSVYQTGDDVTVKWHWSSALTPNTGAGMQNAGDPVSSPILKGSFQVELLTPGDTVVSSQTLTVAEVTYAAATLAASPISNGNFKVRVTQLYNGYSSTPVSFTVTHIA